MLTRKQSRGEVCTFRPGSDHRSTGVSLMANQNHITKPLSAMFRDPSLPAAFRAAEDDGLAPQFRGDRPPDEIDRLLEFLDAPISIQTY